MCINKVLNNEEKQIIEKSIKFIGEIKADEVEFMIGGNQFTVYAMNGFYHLLKIYDQELPYKVSECYKVTPKDSQLIFEFQE